MYNVYTYVYNHKRVCTCYIHFNIFMYMSVHVHDFMNMHKHGVSIPELKKSTNLKMHLKPSVQDVCQNLDSCIVHCRWYTVGEAMPKLNFGSLGGWLEGESRRSSLRKFARARHSVRKQVAPRFKNGPLLKRQIFKIQARLINAR